MKKFKLVFGLTLIAFLVVAFAPVAFAQTNVAKDVCDNLRATNVQGSGGQGGSDTDVTLQFIICKIGNIINIVIPILIALGVLYFIWGVITYVIAKDDEAKSRGRDMMIYGLIGLLVIVCIWGLVAILKNTFGVSGTGTINVPCIESPGNDCPGN